MPTLIVILEVAVNFQVGKYLKLTPVIDCDHRSIQEKARDLTRGQEDIIGKAKSLFYFVRDEIKYNPYVPRFLAEQFRASNTLSRGGLLCSKGGSSLCLSPSCGNPSSSRIG